MLGKIFDLAQYEANHLVRKYLEDQNSPVNYEALCRSIVDPVVKDMLLLANDISEESYQEGRQETLRIRKLLDDYLRENKLDAFVVPTTILPALKRPSPELVQVNGKEFRIMDAYVHNTTPQSVASVPCISLPSGLTPDGLPVGLEVVAPRGEDSSLLNMAAAIQEILPPMPQLNFNEFLRDKL